MDFNMTGIPLDFEKGCVVHFDPKTCLTDEIDTGKRRLSQMKSMFMDQEAADRLVAEVDPLIYEFHSVPVPEREGDLAFGCSIVYPGKVGDEYHFTRGHFHTVLETGEIYYCVTGHGYMMIENPEGDWRCMELTPGCLAYVPPRYAHRSICVGTDEPLRTVFVFRGDAGHDYGTIETKGYRKLLVERDGKPTIIDNPNWL